MFFFFLCTCYRSQKSLIHQECVCYCNDLYLFTMGNFKGCHESRHDTATRLSRTLQHIPSCGPHTLGFIAWKDALSYPNAACIQVCNNLNNFTRVLLQWMVIFLTFFQCRTKRRQSVWVGLDNPWASRITIWRRGFLSGYSLLSGLPLQASKGKVKLQNYCYLS